MLVHVEHALYAQESSWRERRQGPGEVSTLQLASAQVAVKTHLPSIGGLAKLVVLPEFTPLSFSKRS